MARSKTTFQWTSDDPDGEEREIAERRDRRAMRAENDALDALALRLAAMPAVERERLPLDELLQDELAVLARLGRKTAHRRQLIRVQGLLRERDVDAIEAALDGPSAMDAQARELERWRTRVMEGDDDDLQAFIDENPRADRQELRSLIRRARGKGAGAERAHKRLFQVLKEAVGEPG